MAILLREGLEAREKKRLEGGLREGKKSRIFIPATEDKARRSLNSAIKKFVTSELAIPDAENLSSHIDMKEKNILLKLEESHVGEPVVAIFYAGNRNLYICTTNE
jgi:hypothetical protein